MVLEIQVNGDATEFRIFQAGGTRQAPERRLRRVDISAEGLRSAGDEVQGRPRARTASEGLEKLQRVATDLAHRTAHRGGRLATEISPINDADRLGFVKRGAEGTA